MECPRCRVDNRVGRKFCSSCGRPLPVACPSCAHVNDVSDQFCGGCGRPVEPAGHAAPGVYTPRHLAEKILTSRAALEGERKQVTVLFCDVVGSTALAERLGPEVMHDLLNRFFELALAGVHRYEGTVNQFLGDGFMALFGAPIAHEDHARRAVLAALAIQRDLADGRLEAGTAARVTVRMGIHTGLVVVGGIGDNLRMDYTAVGDTTHLAARLQQLAEPGTILLSESTHRFVRGYVRCEAVGPVAVKGRTEPVAAYRVLGPGLRRSPIEALPGRPLSPFVGREREMAVLLDLLAQAERGEGQVVGVVGDPGVGKSRVLLEFRQHLAGRQVTYLEGRCLSYGAAHPYLPLVDIVRSNCRIVEADTPDAIAGKVRYALGELGMDPDAGAPCLLHLLGVKEETERLAVLTPEAVKLRIFDTLREMSLRGSGKRPIVFAVEDLHWVDVTSQEFLASLMEHLPGVRILVVTTYRPGYQPQWIGKSYATQVALRALSRPDSLTVVRAVAEAVGLGAELRDVVLDRAEGNPFFLEELTRAVTEAASHEPAIPETVQGVLMARIDRLPEEPKRLLQTASVLGREFSARLLAAIWDEPGDAGALLATLRRLEFLYELTRADDPVWIFKHALTQEVAYDSLLTTRRQALHAAAGRALEELYAERLEAICDRLAYHYGRSDDPSKAVEYLTRAADKAARSYAHAEALAALAEAVRQAERLPHDRRDRALVDLVRREADSLHFLGRRQEEVDLLGAHEERLTRIGDPSLAGPYYFTLGWAHSFLGQREQATLNVMRAVAAARECGDAVTEGKAFVLVALERSWTGHFAEAIAFIHQAIDRLGPTPERWWLAWAHYILAFDHLARGEFTPALDAAHQANAIGEAMGDRRHCANAASVIGLAHAYTGAWDAGIDWCRRALERSPDAFEAAATLGHLGAAYLEKGDLAAAVPTLEQALAQARRYRSRQLQGWFARLLGEAYLRAGRVAEARALAQDALAVCTDTGFRYEAGSAQRVMGLIAWQAGALDEAERWLRQALETFTSTDARYNLARTHLHLAELAHARENRDMLTTHVREAHAGLVALGAHRYAEGAARLARDSGVSLDADGPSA